MVPASRAGTGTFGVPHHYPLDAATVWIDVDGNKFIKVKGVRWFTNLDFPQRHEDVILYKRY